MSKVSVIIPTYNCAKYITEAIDSVLNQTYKNYEIIVVDDGSTDNTEEMLRDFSNRIKYIYQPNLSPAAARNIGIKASKGKYIAFLDADDYWLSSNKLMIQTEFLERNRNVGLVYSRLPIIKDGQFCGFKPKGLSGKTFIELIIKGGDYPTSSVMVRRECFEKVGFFDEEIRIAEDFDMWLRISRYYKIESIDKPMAVYRIHGSNITLNTRLMYENQIRVYEKIIRNYEDIPIKIVKRKLALNYYELGRIYFSERDYTSASKYICKAILSYPHIGLSVIKPGDSIMMRIRKFIKPCLVFCYVLIMGFITNLIHHKR